MNQSTDEFIPTRQSLLTRLKDWEDREGWKEFFDTYWRMIYSVALKAGLTESEAEEVVQETVVSVAKQMPTFQYDKAGSFKAWLLQISRRRIADQFRKRPPWEVASRSPNTDSTRTPTVDRLTAPEGDLGAVWEEEWKKNLVDAAMDRVKRRVKPIHYQIFYLSVVKELGAARVARTLGVSAAQVYLAKHRVAALVRKEIQQLEKKMDSGKSSPPAN